jgi:hypothetical protein
MEMLQLQDYHLSPLPPCLPSSLPASSLPSPCSHRSLVDFVPRGTNPPELPDLYTPLPKAGAEGTLIDSGVILVPVDGQKSRH